METKNRIKPRGKDILSLLLNHGPLSFSAITKMLIPQMKKKKLKKCLLKLKRQGYISTRLVGDTKTFYQLSQRQSNRIKTAKFLNCLPSNLVQPTFRHQYWIHTECCEFWIFHLSQAFPEAEIIREVDFYDSSVAQRIMLIDKKDFELRPDFLLIFPKTDNTERVSVAVEIERIRKSNRRLIDKLNKYTNKTIIDGLIYICESENLSETIRLLYKNKIVDKSYRVKHYSENFFLFSDAINTHDNPLERLYNSEQNPVNIVPWINYLKSTKRNFRRDHNFPYGGSPTSHI